MKNSLSNQHAMPLHKALRALLGLTWTEAWRGQLFFLLLLLVLVVESLAWFMASMAITESSEIRLAICAWLYRCGLVFIVLVHVIGNLVREVESGFLHVLLAHSLSRTQYVIGRFVGFALIALGAALAISGLLALHTPATGLSGLLLWSASFMLEMLLVTAIAVFFALGFARLLPALLAACTFYVVARLLDVIRAMAQSPIGQDPNSMSVAGSRWVLDGLAWFTPPLGAYTRTDWLLLPDSLATAPSALTLLSWAIAASCLLVTAAIVDFHGHEL